MIVIHWDDVLARVQATDAIEYLALAEERPDGTQEEVGTILLRPLDRSSLGHIRQFLAEDTFASDAAPHMLPPTDLFGEARPEDEDWSHLFQPVGLGVAGADYLRTLAVQNTQGNEATRWRLRALGAGRKVLFRVRFQVQPGPIEDEAASLPSTPELSQLAPTPHVSTAVTPPDSAPPPEADRYSDVDTQFNQFGGHLQVIGDHWDRFGANLAKYYDHMLEQQRVVGERMDQRYGKFLEQSELQILRLLKAASDSHEQVLKVLKQRETEERLRVHDQTELETARDQRKLVGELAKDGLGKLSNIGEMVLMSEMGMDPQLAELGKLVAANPELAEKLKDPDLIALLKDPEIAGQVGDVLASLAEAGRAQRMAREQADAEAAAQAQAGAGAPPAPAPAPPPPGAPADLPASDATPSTPEPGPSAEPS